MAPGRSVCTRSGKATFSNTLRSENSAPLWNSMPMRRRRANSALRDSRCTSSPSIVTRPASGASCPPISLSRVVLPVPLGPMMAVILPRGICRSTPRKISVSPREKCSPSTTTKGVSLIGLSSQQRIIEHRILTGLGNATSARAAACTGRPQAV
jgi:hypothetical protein